QAVGHGAKEASLVHATKTAGGGRAQEVIVNQRRISSRCGSKGFAVRPFDLHWSNRKKERPREIGLASNARLSECLLDDTLRHALAELGRAERFDLNEINRAGNGGL